MLGIDADRAFNIVLDGELSGLVAGGIEPPADLDLAAIDLGDECAGCALRGGLLIGSATFEDLDVGDVFYTIQGDDGVALLEWSALEDDLLILGDAEGAVLVDVDVDVIALPVGALCLGTGGAGDGQRQQQQGKQREATNSDGGFESQYRQVRYSPRH